MNLIKTKQSNKVNFSHFISRRVYKINKLFSSQNMIGFKRYY